MKIFVLPAVQKELFCRAVVPLVIGGKAAGTSRGRAQEDRRRKGLEYFSRLTIDKRCEWWYNVSRTYGDNREQAGEVSEGFPYLPFFPPAIPTLQLSVEIWSSACQTDELHFT